MNTKTFIEKAKAIYGDKYDYSKCEYIGTHKKVCVICPEHGEFFVTPANHTSKHNHCGCPKCAGKHKTTEIFINEAKKVHGDKYDYSKVVYEKNNKKVCIICPKHGEFWMTPNGHLNNRGCKKCGKEKLKKEFSRTTEMFIEEARKVHGDKYDYSKVNYNNCKTKVCIICPEHGEFWQVPDSHLRGMGCIQCSGNHKSVDKISLFLANKKILFEREKGFKWLGRQRLDFYLPDYEIAIEYQGEQHFHPVKYFGGEQRFKDRKKRDEVKRMLCEKNGIRLIYVSFWEKAPNGVVKTIEELYKCIIEYDKY